MGQRRGQAKQEGISVFVRVRASGAQDERDSSQVVEINESNTSLCVRDAQRPSKSIECAFDRVFGPESVQEDVFLGLVPALDTVIKGFNACVLAYGQTGAGKTHTLIGPGGGTRLPDNQAEWGIIPRAVQFLFDRLALVSEEDETFSYSVTCSFLQIYNENLVDLLVQDGGVAGAAADSASLQIREETGGGRGRGGVIAGGRYRRRHDGGGGGGGGEDATTVADGGGGGVLGVVGHHRNRASKEPSGGKANENRRVFVNGLSSFRVGGAQDVLRYVNLGAANRRVRATQHNEASSRSHAVMQLTVEAKSGGGGVEEGGGGGSNGVGKNDHVTYRQAKLSLVDLAGSEKMDSGLKISKGHFKELRSINQSLSTLGNVVSALSEKGRTHVPYRDSKLTRLLQDSLGGNTRTTIIACVNPIAGQIHETVDTLQFADRAKKVMVRLRANEVVDDRVLLARAQAEIKRLKRRLREALEGTLLGVAEDHDGGGNADEENSGGCHQTEGGRCSDDITKLSKKTKIGALDRCIGESGGEGTQGREGGAENAEVATAGTNSGGQPYCLSTEEGEEKAARISAAAANPALERTQKRQATKLIAENERLREDNDSLRADVQRLVLQSNKQRLRRQRQQQRSIGRSGNIPTGPPSAPIDWSTRYTDAAADARRRRPESSHHANSHSRVNRSASSSRVMMMARKRRSSPTTAPARVPNLPKFCRRQFGVDGDVGEGVESEGEPTEDGLSVEEVQAIIGGSDEVEATKMMLAPTGNPEEGGEEAVAAIQLEMFRRELQEGVVSGSSVQRGGGGGEEEAGAAPANSGIVAGRNGGVASGNPDEETDIEVFLDKSQRLEDLMFEAQGRERRRLREERGHLASARKQRLELEAQLAALTGGVSTTDGIHAHIPANMLTLKSGVTVNRTHVPRLAVNSATPSSSAEEGRVQPPKSTAWNHQQQQRNQKQPPPPCFDGGISVLDENRTTMASSPTLGVVGRNEVKNSHHNSSCGGEKRIGWAEQPSDSTEDAPTPVATTPTTTTITIPATTATTTAMMMAVLAPPEQPGGNSSDVHGSNRRGSNVSNNPALGARRTVPAANPPPERRRQQAGRVFPVAIPMSHPNCPPSPGSRRRRPATSTGGPPTGSNRARSRSRSRRTQLRVGRVSRSPVRGDRLAFLGPASPQCDRNGDGRGNGQQRGLRQKQGGLGGGVGGGDSMTSPAHTAAAPKALHPRITLSSPEKPRRFGRGAGRSDFTGSDWNEKLGATKGGLAYGVADLGLRLKVYSFRYDHHYECQVVGYDSRRRMHRCAYDVTGEKQWHELANKRFEVVGQNGAVFRSTESAPPAPAPARPKTSSGTPPLLLIPTSPDMTPLDTSVGGGGGGGGGGR